MTLDQFASIGEMIGGLAVVLTLVYLAFETRRSTSIHIASTTSDSYLQWAEINDLLSNNNELAKLWVRIFDNQSLDDFDPAELLQINLSIRSVIQRLAAIHQQHENGLIDDEFWQIHKVYFASWLQVRGLAEWWELEKQSSLFTESFIHELDQTSGFTMSSAAQMVRE